MLFKELSGKNARAFYDVRVKELRSMYADSQKRLATIVRSVGSTSFQVSRATVLLRQVNAEIKSLNLKSRKWAVRNTPEAYTRGVEFAEERLRAMEITKRVKIGAQVHKTAVTAITDQMTIDFLNANGSMGRRISEYIRRSQQKVLEEKAIDRSIAEGLIEGESRRTTSDRIYSDLRAKMGDEQFIQINGRNFDPTSYSELVARTRTREATTKGTINSALQYGMDLVQISVSSEPCKICQQYQGKVYSISGADEDFPPLKEEPPYHPNCEHVLLPVNKSVLEDRGQLETLKDFSNSKEKSVSTFNEFEKMLDEDFVPEKKQELVPGDVRQFRDHIKYNAGQGGVQFEKAVGQVMADTSYSRKEAERVVGSVSTWGGEDGAKLMRMAQKDPKGLMQDIEAGEIPGLSLKEIQQDADTLERYIAKAPGYDKPIYRGIAVEDPKIGKVFETLQEGDVIDMKGLSSWSSDKFMAEEFATRFGQSHSIVFQTEKPIIKGTSITHLSPFADENEVVVSSQARFRIVKRAVKKTSFGAQVLITVEEIR